ncbi:lipopolysaccharide biosynthesis protein [Arthrobacter sp. OAP107]|uniref:lipopolysaccharide biosynthesis protein n=1 Tax=Arthrobacter sp. OAP107 TaxID=3156445 RepID=UPI0033962D3F
MLGSFSWLAGGRILSALIQMLSLGLFANWVSPSTFGIVASVTAIAVIPQNLFDFGISTYIVRHRAADPNDGTVTFALRISGRISILLGVAFIVTLGVLGLWIDPLYAWLLPLALWVGAERNAEVWMGIALADGDAKLSVASLLGRRIGSLMLLVTIQYFTSLPELAYSVSLGMTSLVAAAVGRHILRPRLPRRRRMTLRSLIATTWPYWLHSTATQVRNVDTALVAVFASPAQAGFYAVASRLTNPLRILPSSLAAVVLPAVARTQGVVNKRTAVVIAYMIGSMAAFYCLIAVLVPWVVPLVLGDVYSSAVTPIQIVCFGLVFGASASILASLLQAKGFAKAVSFSSLAASLFCVPAITLGSVYWGAAGAAIGLVSSFAVQTLALVFHLWKVTRGGSDFK